jgi:hypothetical protein
LLVKAPRAGLFVEPISADKRNWCSSCS